MNPRIKIIQRAIDRLGARTYLEIGVADARTFLAINAPRKIGVDPKKPCPQLFEVANNATIRSFQLTSDEFFLKAGSLFAENRIDVAFVDGLHEWRQAARDVENCLRHLSDSGVIVMHDCSPTNEIMTTPADQLAAIRAAGKWTGSSWTGDTWKAIACLRSTRDDLNIFVLDTDWGLGIVTRGAPEGMLDYTPDQIASMRYADLDRDRERILNLKDPAVYDDFLDTLAPINAPAELV